MYLDFGAQNNTTQVRLINGSYITLGSATYLTEWFAAGYTACGSGGYDVTLAMTVNNDGTAVGTSTGVAWMQATNNAYNFTVSNNYSNVLVVSGVDWEPWSGPHATGAVARQWISGWGSQNSNFLLLYDFGSADGCPQNTHTNGACNNGWTQDDKYFGAWGYSSAYAVPQIYTTNGTQAAQWSEICQWGVSGHGSAVLYKGPQDEYDLDPTTNTPSAAYGQLFYLLNLYAPCAQDFPYSVEIHSAT